MSKLRLDHEPWPEIFHENWTACLRTLGRSQWPMYGTGDLRNGKGAEHRTCVVANVRTSAGAEFRTCGTPRVRSYAPAEWRTCGTPHWWRPGVMNVVESVREFWPQRIFQISKRYLRNYFIFFRTCGFEIRSGPWIGTPVHLPSAWWGVPAAAAAAANVPPSPSHRSGSVTRGLPPAAACRNKPRSTCWRPSVKLSCLQGTERRKHIGSGWDGEFWEALTFCSKII